MPASFLPFGFVPVAHLNGGMNWIDCLTDGIASTYGADLFRGDPVKLMTGGVIERAAAGDAISGVFAGCEFIDQTGRFTQLNYWPSGQVATKIKVLCWFDDRLILEAQADATAAKTARGDATDHQLGTGNVKSGMSGASLDISLAGNGNSAQWKIVDIAPRVGNDWGDAYPILRVMRNENNLGRMPGNAI